MKVLSFVVFQESDVFERLRSNKETLKTVNSKISIAIYNRLDELSQAVKDAGVLYGVFRGVNDGVFHGLVTF